MKTETSNSSELQSQGDQPNKEICANCGNALVGEYCHGCGEKPLTHHDLTVKHFIAHTVVHEFTHLNSSIFQTLKLHVTNPGFLAEEYCNSALLLPKR